jgi:hypothetical protein
MMRRCVAKYFVTLLVVAQHAREYRDEIYYVLRLRRREEI